MINQLYLSLRKINNNSLFAFIFIVFINIFYTSNGWTYHVSIMNSFIIFAFLFGLIDIFMHHEEIYKIFLHNKNLTILVSILILMTIIKFILNQDTRLIISVMAIFIAVYFPLYKIFYITFFTKFITFIIYYFIGGYTHLNYISVHFGMIILLYLIISYKINRFNLKCSLVLLIIGYFISKSGAFLMCCGLAILLFYLLKLKFRYLLCSTRFVEYYFPFMMLLTVLLGLAYMSYANDFINFGVLRSITPKFLCNIFAFILRLVDKVFTGRISLGGFSLYCFGISLFGGNIDYSVNTGLKYFVVDSGLLLLLQDWGLIITILMSVIFIMLMRMLMKNKEYALIVYMLIIILWSFNEDIFISVGSNFAFYIFGHELRRRHIKAYE